LAYCEIYFPLIKHSYDKNGRSTGSKLDQLQSVAKMIKKPIPELVKLEESAPDTTILYILDIFYTLKKADHITFQEIMAYTVLMDVNLDPEEIDAIFAIERLYNMFIR